MQRWPYVALGAAGLLWWYYLTPSLLGLLIIAFAIAAYRKSRKVTPLSPRSPSDWSLQRPVQPHDDSLTNDTPAVVSTTGAAASKIARRSPPRGG